MNPIAYLFCVSLRTVSIAGPYYTSTDRVNIVAQDGEEAIRCARELIMINCFDDDQRRRVEARLMSVEVIAPVHTMADLASKRP